MPKINTVAIGGVHQFLHFLPVVFELAAQGKAEVEIFVGSPADGEAVERLARELGHEAPRVTWMMLPVMDRSVRKRIQPARSLKIVRLLLWARRLRDADAILCAERTSTALKRLPGRCPPIIHFRHGAGDRAAGFEPRIKLFDHVLTIGDKDRERTVAERLVPAERCHVAGPIKLASIALGTENGPLFDNERPTILYNPHFHRQYGSFDAVAARLLERVLADGRYNLVIAPHSRLAAQLSSQDLARWQARSVRGQVIVDMGSVRSVDMTYTLGTDVYLGDLSSQVYEFIVRPRPCVFVDMGAAGWKDDPNFAMWHFGPVIRPADDPLSAIDAAFQSFAQFRPWQEQRAHAAFGDPFFNCPADERRMRARATIARAADLLSELIG